MDRANNKDSLFLKGIVQKLSTNELPPVTLQRSVRQAGVALILKLFREELKVLFIRRATRENDPWSGHIAFPGGHHDQSDADLLHTVLRETQEEIGVSLNRSDCLGQLPLEIPYTADQRSNLVVVPFVFLLNHEPELNLNHEVSEVIWVSLKRLISDELLTHEAVHFNANEYRLPGFRLSGNHFVWGLTYRVLLRFFSIVKRP